MKRASMIAAMGAAMFTATAAHAQADPDKALDRADARLNRPEPAERAAARSLVTGAAKPAETHWTFSLLGPVTFNSNVANAETNPDSAFHFAPEATLAGSWKLDSDVTFFVMGDVNLDSYFTHRENDASTYSARAGFRFGDATTGISPYIHYTMLSLYSGQFGHHDVTVHHFVAGAKRSWTLGKDQALTLDANFLRREATVASVELDRGTFDLTFTQGLSATTTLTVEGTGQYAHYTGGTSIGRDDQNLKLSAGISHELGDLFTLDVTAYFQRNWSNVIGKGYSTFDVGPTLSLTKKF
jgi:hypothetical protein